MFSLFSPKPLHYLKVWVQVLWVVGSISCTSTSSLGCSFLVNAWTFDFPASSGSDAFVSADFLACDFLSFPSLSGRFPLICKDLVKMSSPLSSFLTPALCPGGMISCFLLWLFMTFPTNVYQCLIWHYIVTCIRVFYSQHMWMCVCVCVYMSGT